MVCGPAMINDEDQLLSNIYFHFLFKFNSWIYDKYLTPYLLLVYLVLAPNFDMSVKGWLDGIKSCLIVRTDNEH